MKSDEILAEFFVQLLGYDAGVCPPDCAQPCHAVIARSNEKGLCESCFVRWARKKAGEEE